MGRKRSRQRQPSSAPPAPRRAPRLLPAALLIALAGSIVYANSLNGPFVFDDHRTIQDNASIRHLWPLTTVLRSQRQTPVAGRPLANLSFAVNYAIGGERVPGYHVFNLAVHILAALALFGLLRRIGNWPAPMPSDAGTADWWALACAMLWMLHPLNSEVVNYVTQRTESMAALCFLLTLYGSVRAWSSGHAGRWHTVAVLANACGMATKESMAVAPVMVVLCDRALAFPSLSSAFRSRGRFYLSLAAGWLLLAMLATGSPFFSSTGFDTHVTRWTYLLNQAPAIAGYLRLSLWPRHLVLDYGVPQGLTLADVWPSALVVVTLLVLALVALVRAPGLGFWGAWFFVTLAPSSTVVPIPTEVAAERRMYLPLVAVVVVLVGVGRLAGRRLVTIATRAPDERSPAGRRSAGLAVAVAALALLGAATMRRNVEYRTGLSIWQTVVERRPHARAHANLAVALRDGGRVDEAIAHLRMAAPEDPNAKHALGSALLERGDIRGAVAELDEFVRARPADPEIASARRELAAALVRAGDIDRAIAELRRVLPLQPRNASVHRALIDLLLQQQRFPDAEAEARILVALGPDEGEAHNALGIALASQGRLDEATKEFSDAVRLDPGSREARDNLNRALTFGAGRGGGTLPRPGRGTAAPPPSSNRP